MDMQNYARMQEDQLAVEITGLNERLAQAIDPKCPNARCVSSYLKQLVKNKRNKLATLRYQRGRLN